MRHRAHFAALMTTSPSSRRSTALLRTSHGRTCRAYRTTGQEVYIRRASAEKLSDGSDNYRDLGVIEAEEGMIRYRAPANSVTTFLGVEG